ncbi:MAG: tRNA 2-thiouridine(34) synthase MnmA [Parachlamydiaceae bacterium]
MAKVIVGMSGGVDSSVSAWLLKQAGHEVIGLFMKNWEEDGICPAAADFEDVSLVCKEIGIPYYTVNFAKEYQEQVFSDFLSESLSGRTPNPDILCNREIKFKVFYDKAMELGSDYLATGHYAQVGKEDGKASLLRGNDAGKDQSYFLYAVRSEVLERVMFPIGHLPKSEVRRLALEAGLATAKKKDSTGICFVGKRDFRTFLSEHLKAVPGPFITPEGKVVGEHIGLPYYTIGQRKGLGLGGPGDAWFVAQKNLVANTVTVVQGEEHPLLYSDGLITLQPHWISGTPPSAFPYRCTAKVRYRQPDFPCEVHLLPDGGLNVQFDSPQRAVTPGQSIVFYQGPLCLGGAIIS